MAATAAAPAAAAPPTETKDTAAATSGTRPPKPDEAAFKVALANAEKEHKASMDKLVGLLIGFLNDIGWSLWYTWLCLHARHRFNNTLCAS